MAAIPLMSHSESIQMLLRTEPKPLDGEPTRYRVGTTTRPKATPSMQQLVIPNLIPLHLGRTPAK